jgi:hypothetical protein
VGRSIEIFLDIVKNSLNQNEIQLQKSINFQEKDSNGDGLRCVI